MAKTTKNTESGVKSGDSKSDHKTEHKSAEPKSGGKSLEERLSRLEVLGEEIRKPDIPLDDALKAFEEGIKLARSLEKELEKIQNRIEILMNGAEAKAADNPELELFDTE